MTQPTATSSRSMSAHAMFAGVGSVNIALSVFDCLLVHAITYTMLARIAITLVGRLANPTDAMIDAALKAASFRRLMGHQQPPRLQARSTCRFGHQAE